MKKIVLFFLFNTILISAFSQSGRDQKKANIATEEWRYEINCKGTGGADNSYLLDVVSYLRDDKLSINQSKKNAVHGIIFKGVFGNTVGCEAKPALSSNPNLFDQKREYFDAFFADGGTFSKFVLLPTGRPDMVDEVSKNEFRVNMTAQVDINGLRAQLEADGIIEKFAKLDANIIRPSTLIYPSDTWAKEKGYVKKTDDQNGGFTETIDYEKAALDPDFLTASSAVSKLLLKRDYAARNLTELIEAVKQDKLVKKYSDNARQVSMLDQILNVAKADIKISVYWKVIPKPPNFQLEYILNATDSYTSLPVSLASGFGPESRSASIGELIVQSVNDKMDGFTSLFQVYFDKMQTSGRNVQVEVAVSDAFDGNLDKLYPVDGEEYSLKEIINAWFSEFAKSDPNVTSSSKTAMVLKDLRIPLTKVSKLSKSAKPSAVNTETFLDDLKRHLKSKYGISSTIESRGLGMATIYIGVSD
jgi:hypothetical protein